MEADDLLNEVGNEKKCPSGTQDVFFKYFPSPEAAQEAQQEAPGVRWAVRKGERSAAWTTDSGSEEQGKASQALLARVSLETDPNTQTGPLRLLCFHQSLGLLQ